MELLTLDSNYQPARIVERYDSLIWAERYFAPGDFELKTTDVGRMLRLLPLESCVTLRESTVPMLVEQHKIEEDEDGTPVVTIKGRSFDCVLERRVAVKRATSTGERLPWTENRVKESDAAYQVMRQILGDGVRGALPAVAPMLSPLDALPMVDLPIPTDYSALTTTAYDVPPDLLSVAVRNLLGLNYHGLKAVRPAQGSNLVKLEIYNGADLTNILVFDARFDYFKNATYLLSYLGSTNVAEVFSSTVSQTVPKTAAPEPSGLARRVLYLDVSQEAGTNSEEARRTRGLIELYKFNATALFDGQIGDQVAAGYNRDYFLGDIVRLDGEYGLSENVRVSEFIRSESNTGSKAYPTFEMVV